MDYKEEILAMTYKISFLESRIEMLSRKVDDLELDRKIEEKVLLKLIKNEKILEDKIGG